MAEYLGVPNGLMVKQVAHKSEAATAGLKAFDVILKVGPEAVTTLSDWDRALRANQGKPVQVTILRDRKQQTLTLQVDSKHKQGDLELQDLFGAGDGPLVAEMLPDPEFVQQFAGQREAAAQAMKEQAEKLKEQLKSGGMGQFGISQQQAEELRKQAEKLRESLKTEDFKIDPKSMDELKQQMEELRKSFKAEDFKVDPKQLEQLKQQMDEMRKNFKTEDFKDFKIDQKQLDELKRQMEEMKALGLGSSV
jgi:membrane-associated protease RseP (regulator of RpoE activity)